MFGDIRGHSADDDTASSATTGHELLEWSATVGHELLERSATAGQELLERFATAGSATAELSLLEHPPAAAG